MIIRINVEESCDRHVSSVSLKRVFFNSEGYLIIHHFLLEHGPSLESQHGDPDHPKGLFNYSFYH